MKKILALVFVWVAMLMAGMAEAGVEINGAGATFPYPLYAAWAMEYAKASGVHVNYQSIGSGGGQRQINERTVDFGASDDPIETSKLDEMKLWQFPSVVGGVVPVTNLDGVAPGELALDGPALCAIFAGKIKVWNDPAILALNKGKALPNMPITPVYRSDGSGTTAIFTEYLSRVCPQWKTTVGAGKSVKWPVGIGGKGNEGVAGFVKQKKGSIGYVEFAYAKQNKLDFIKLKNASGAVVEPDAKSFKAAADASLFDPGKHFYAWLIDAPGKDAWPIAGATFILLARDKAVNGEVVKFFDWAYANGDKTAQDLTYVPLPDALKKKVRAYWKQNKID